MKSFIKITLIPVFLFVVLIAIEGKGIYVSMNGSDDAPGTLDKPVAGITAASRLALPGDTVFVRSGGYHVKEQIRILSSGTPGHVITYMPYPGEEAAFNVDLIPWPQPKAGEHYSPTVGALQIENVHHIKVEDIGIRYSHRAGIIIRNSSLSLIHI